MSEYDQKNQRVQNQYNADRIDISINPPAPTADELVSNAKKLLSLKSYSQAIKVFGQALESCADLSEAHYYLSFALLRGNRPKLSSLSIIKEIEDHLQTVIQLQPHAGEAYVLWALVKYDFYVLNGMFDRPPSYQDLLRKDWSLRHAKAAEILAVVNAEGNVVWNWLKDQL